MDLLVTSVDPNIDSDHTLLPAILDFDLDHSFNDPNTFLSPIFDFDANQFLYDNNSAINSNLTEQQPGCLLYEPVSNSELLAPNLCKPRENYDCFTFDLNKFNESLLAPAPSSSPSPSLTSLMEIPEDQFYNLDLANQIDLLLTTLPNPQLSVLSPLSLPSPPPPVFNTLENLNNESHANPSGSLSSLSLSSPSPSLSSTFSSSSISSDSNLSPLPSSPEVVKRNVRKRKRETLDNEMKIAATTNSTVEKVKQMRKREQNRQASIRYRQKKKTEFENMINEEKQLSQDVRQLQSKIDKMKMWVECFENLYQEMSSTSN